MDSWLATVFVLALFAVCEGSKIQFNASPTDILEGLTGSITLRCSLNDTASASGNLIGRRDVSDKRDVMSTPDNVEEVTSVIIMQGGMDLASVSHRHPATVLDGSGNALAVGNISGSTGEGFLELTYTQPSVNESGEFFCEVNTVSTHGHGRVYSAGLEVAVAQPSLADLINYVNNLEVKHDKEMLQLKQEKDSLKGRLDELEHSETGFIECETKTATGAGSDGRAISTEGGVLLQDLPTTVREPSFGEAGRGRDGPHQSKEHPLPDRRHQRHYHRVHHAVRHVE